MSSNHTVSDYFIKFGWVRALPTKEAFNVVNSLSEVIIIILVVIM